MGISVIMHHTARIRKSTPACRWQWSHMKVWWFPLQAWMPMPMSKSPGHFCNFASRTAMYHKITYIIAWYEVSGDFLGCPCVRILYGFSAVSVDPAAMNHPGQFIRISRPHDEGLKHGLIALWASVPWSHRVRSMGNYRWLKYYWFLGID